MRLVLENHMHHECSRNRATGVYPVRYISYLFLIMIECFRGAVAFGKELWRAISWGILLRERILPQGYAENL